MAGSRVRVDAPSSVVITFSRESSIKIKSFLSQWMADLGSDATRHFNSRGSPSDNATSRGFSLKKGTVPSITSLTVSTYKFGNLMNANGNVIQKRYSVYNIKQYKKKRK